MPVKNHKPYFFISEAKISQLVKQTELGDKTIGLSFITFNQWDTSDCNR